MARGGGVCAWCGTEMTEDNAQIDHVVPRCEGGGDELSNLVPACPRCNAARASLEAFSVRLETLGIDADERRAAVEVQRAQPIDRAAGLALANLWYPWHVAMAEKNKRKQRARDARRRAPSDTSFSYGPLAPEEPEVTS